MKTKLTSMVWRGSASVDPRFSSSMLKWSIADIRNRETSQKVSVNYTSSENLCLIRSLTPSFQLSVGIEVGGILEAYNADFELQFRHNLKYIVGMCRYGNMEYPIRDSLSS